jgi:hypothetical protein
MKDKNLGSQATIDELLEICSNIDHEYFFQRIYDIIIEARP